jgi:predicted alpha/beta-fold hydrolase
VSDFPIDTSFRPPRWIRGRHAQTILPNLPMRRRRIERRALPMLAAAREKLLDCGDGVTLQCFHSSPAVRGRLPGAQLAVLLHGWEGSADSSYMLSLAHRLFAAGFEVVRLNLRDHGATHHLNQAIFHSCLLPEVVGALRALAAGFPGLPMSLIGFSLGGNFMLRAAADPQAASLPLARVVAISPVLDPAVTMDTLEHGPRIYHEYFVRKWTRSLAKKQLAWPEHYDFGDLLRVRSLRAMTRELVQRHTPFADLTEYLAGYAITGNRLTTLVAPATILTSLDDPIIDAGDLARVARCAQLDIVTTSHGGHCGFIEGLGDSNWVDARVAALLSPNPNS